VLLYYAGFVAALSAVLESRLQQRRLGAAFLWLTRPYLNGLAL